MFCFCVRNVAVLPSSVSVIIMVSPLGIFFRSASILASVFCLFLALYLRLAFRQYLRSSSPCLWFLVILYNSVCYC